MAERASATTKPLVLVADDEITARELLTEILRQAGFRTLAASNGDEALRLACEYQPAIILLDVMMPRMDGYTALARLREHPMTTDVPVVMLTGWQDPGFRELSKGVGAQAHVTKPYLPDELLETVRRVLGQRQS